MSNNFINHNHGQYSIIFYFVIARQQHKNKRIMAAKLDTSQHACHWPRKRLVGHINFGPRFDEDIIRVSRTDPEPDGTDSASFSLYYRVYNPSSIYSSESPPLIVIHGGP